MLGTSLESFILLRVTVFVYGGGEVAAVNAELVPPHVVRSVSNSYELVQERDLWNIYPT